MSPPPPAPHSPPAGLVVSRALRTVDRSQDLGLKMLKQPTHKQMDYYYSNLLGKDWQQQLEQVGGDEGSGCAG